MLLQKDEIRIRGMLIPPSSISSDGFTDEVISRFTHGLKMLGIEPRQQHPAYSGMDMQEWLHEIVRSIAGTAKVPPAKFTIGEWVEVDLWGGITVGFEDDYAGHRFLAVSVFHPDGPVKGTLSLPYQSLITTLQAPSRVRFKIPMTRVIPATALFDAISATIGGRGIYNIRVDPFHQHGSAKSTGYVTFHSFADASTLLQIRKDLKDPTRVVILGDHTDKEIADIILKMQELCGVYVYGKIGGAGISNCSIRVDTPATAKRLVEEGIATPDGKLSFAYVGKFWQGEGAEVPIMTIEDPDMFPKPLVNNLAYRYAPNGSPRNPDTVPLASLYEAPPLELCTECQANGSGLFTNFGDGVWEGASAMKLEGETFAGEVKAISVERVARGFQFGASERNPGAASWQPPQAQPMPVVAEPPVGVPPDDQPHQALQAAQRIPHPAASEPHLPYAAYVHPIQAAAFLSPDAHQPVPNVAPQQQDAWNHPQPGLIDEQPRPDQVLGVALNVTAYVQEPAHGQAPREWQNGGQGQYAPQQQMAPVALPETGAQGPDLDVRQAQQQIDVPRPHVNGSAFGSGSSGNANANANANGGGAAIASGVINNGNPNVTNNGNAHVNGFNQFNHPPNNGGRIINGAAINHRLGMPTGGANINGNVPPNGTGFRPPNASALSFPGNNNNRPSTGFGTNVATGAKSGGGSLSRAKQALQKKTEEVERLRNIQRAAEMAARGAMGLGAGANGAGSGGGGGGAMRPPGQGVNNGNPNRFRPNQSGPVNVQRGSANGPYGQQGRGSQGGGGQGGGWGQQGGGREEEGSGGVVL